MRNALRKCLLGVVLLMSGEAAAQRQIFAVFPPMSYYYVILHNPSTTSQTVNVRFRSSGLNLEVGGFPLKWAWVLPDFGAAFAALRGSPSAGGVAGDGVECTSATQCQNKAAYRTMAPGAILRLGAGSQRAPYTETAPVGNQSGAQAAVSTSSTMGVALEVTVTENDGYLVGSAYSYLDISDGSSSADTPFFVPLNAGRPF